MCFLRSQYSTGVFGGRQSPPPRTFMDVIFGQGQPSRKISAPARDFFKPARKQLPAPPENKKKHTALAFLKPA
jgi:hypothetical protein